MTFEETVYSVYKDNWFQERVKNGSLTLSDILAFAEDYKDSTEGEEITALEYIETEGDLAGECFVSYEEFLDNEYQDEEIMKEILGGETDLFREWQQRHQEVLSPGQ